MKVFLTMMALKDADHICRHSAYELGQKSRKDERVVLEALKILSSPDTKRLEPQPFEGRRIKAVEEGWLILNGEKYREMVSIEMKRARNRKAQAAWRSREKASKSQSQIQRENEGREKRFVGADGEGNEEKADGICAENL